MLIGMAVYTSATSAGACRFYVGLADQIKILDSPEFEAYVDEYLQKCFPIKFVPKSPLDNIDGNI